MSPNEDNVEIPGPRAGGAKHVLVLTLAVIAIAGALWMREHPRSGDRSDTTLDRVLPPITDSLATGEKLAIPQQGAMDRDTASQAVANDPRQSSPQLQPPMPAPGALSVYQELAQVRSAVYAEMSLLTAPAYDDMFDRGEYTVHTTTAEAGDLKGKLVSFRFQPDGSIWFATLPRAGFEHAYSLKDHYDQLDRDYRQMGAALDELK